jgi:hypothetical protein
MAFWPTRIIQLVSLKKYIYILFKAGSNPLTGERWELPLAMGFHRFLLLFSKIENILYYLQP